MSSPDLLTLTRTTFLDARTLGKLDYQGQPFGYTCEDTDRGLDSRMPAALLAGLKIKRATAIPVGRYQLVWAPSPSRGVETPRVAFVPGFQGILIHAGNDENDSEGCLLPGTVLLPGDMGVGHSQIACSWLYPRIREACALGPQSITVRREPVAWARRCSAVPGLGWEP